MSDQSPADFRRVAAELAAQDGRAAMQPVIEKELLHYEILNAMDEAGHLDRLAFQGGTCLRLCYLADRYSEDLDFAGGTDFTSDDVPGLADLLRTAVAARYAVEVDVDAPRTPVRRDENSGIGVDTWLIKVVTAPARPDLPKQRISVQIANVPAHTRVVSPVQVRYPGLPASYGQILVVCESVEEICADKLKAFATSRFVRYRDLWDLRWLSMQPGFDAEQLPGLLARKITDYRAESAFSTGLDRLANLPEIVEGGAFTTQLQRFLPAPTLARTLDRPAFRADLTTRVLDLYRRAGVSP